MVIQRLRPLFSGHGVQVEALSKELAGRGLETIILTAGHGKNPPWEDIDGYRVRRLRCDIPLLSRLLRRARFRSEIFGLRAFAWFLGHGRRPAVVHVHALTDALLTTWLYCRWRRIPIVFEMTLLGTDDPLTVRCGRNLFRGLRYRVYSRFDGYVAISPALAAAYTQAGLPSAKLRMIPQGVDITRFAPSDDRRALRRRHALPTEGPLVVFVGSLIERKGIDLLLAAWARVHEHHPTACLVLVGRNRFDDNPEAQAFLDRHLDALSGAVRGAVHQVGIRDDVDELLQASDLFVFPSRREGFGTVMIEAMACSLPCVVTELPDITDYIFATGDDGRPGIVIEQDDADRFADAMMTVLSNPEKAATLGAAARQRVVERFSIGRIADQYIEFYGELAARDGSA